MTLLTRGRRTRRHRRPAPQPAARHAAPAAPSVGDTPSPAAGIPWSAYLRVFADGTQIDQMPLVGLPCFLGTARAADGRPFAGIAISTTPDERPEIVLDVSSTELLDDMITELATARDELRAAQAAGMAAMRNGRYRRLVVLGGAR
jgi:hypothetical protein